MLMTVMEEEEGSCVCGVLALLCLLYLLLCLVL
jgi:hypothetical protein